MNKNGKEIGLKNSNYANTNGLGNINNVSSVSDVATLSCITMKDPLF